MSTGADKRATLSFHFRGRVFVTEQQYSRERIALSDLWSRAGITPENRRANRERIRRCLKSPPVVFQAGQCTLRLRLTLENTPYFLGTPTPRSTSPRPAYSVRRFEKESSARRSANTLVASRKTLSRKRTAGCVLYRSCRSGSRTIEPSHKTGFTRFRLSYRAVGRAREIAPALLVVLGRTAAGLSGDVSFCSSWGVNGFDFFCAPCPGFQDRSHFF